VASSPLVNWRSCITDLAKLVVTLEAESSKLRSELQSTNKRMVEWERETKISINNIKGHFKGLGAAIAGGAVAASLTAMTKRALDYADGIADAAEKTAFSAKRLQELRYAAEQNGIAWNTLEGALARYTKRIGLARAGTGAAAETYRKLGIDLSKSNEEIFQQVVATFGEMEDETNRLALATRLFGDDAQRMAVLLKGGNEELEKYAKRAHETGQVLSDELVQGASDANDRLDTMKKIVDLQFTAALASLAPIITDVGDAAAKAAVKFGDMVNQFQAVERQGIKAVLVNLEDAQEKLGRIQEKYDKALEAQGGASPRMRKAQQARLSSLRNELQAADDMVAQLTKRYAMLIDPAPVIKKKPAAVDPSALFSLADDGASKGRIKAVADEEGRLTKALQEQAEWRSKLQAVIDDVDPVAPLLRQLDALEDLKREFPNYADIISEKMLSVHEDMDKLNAGLEEQSEKLEKTKSMASEIGQAFNTAFENAIVDAQSFGDVLKALEQDMLRIFLKKKVSTPLYNAFEKAIGGFDITSFFGGARASGGPVESGKAYLVGEYGPEIFAPQSVGTIIPNSGLAVRGRAAIVNNWSIHTPNADSFRKTQRQILQETNRALRRGF